MPVDESTLWNLGWRAKAVVVDIPGSTERLGESGGARSTEMINCDSKQQDPAPRSILIEDWHVHETHAVVETSHQQRSQKRP